MSAYDQKLLAAHQDTAKHLQQIAEQLDEIRVELKKKRIQDDEHFKMRMSGVPF